MRRPPAAVRCRCGAWRRKGYTPEYEKLAPTALKSREIRKFVGPITSTLSDLPPASTGLLEAATGRSLWVLLTGTSDSSSTCLAAQDPPSS